MEPVDLAPERGMEGAVRLVIRHERFAQLTLEGAPVCDGEPRHLGIDLTRYLVLPALVRALALETAKLGHVSSVMQAWCRVAVT